MPAGKKYGGRQKGTKNKLIPEMKKLSNTAMERITENYGIGIDGKETPLEFLMRIQNDSSIDLEIRIECAKSSIAYIHQRQPQSMEHSGPDEGAIELSLLADDAHRSLENLIFIEPVDDDE